MSRPGRTTLAFFLLPFTALLAVVARAPFPAWLPRMLGDDRGRAGHAVRRVGIWQAVTHELLFFAPKLEVANTYAPSSGSPRSSATRASTDGTSCSGSSCWSCRLAARIRSRRRGPDRVLWAGLSSRTPSPAWPRCSSSCSRSPRRGRPGVPDRSGGGTAALLPRRHGAWSFTRRATPRCGERRATVAPGGAHRRVFARASVAGVGIGSQPRASQQLSSAAGPTPNFVSHTTPLTVAAELGVIGLLAYAAPARRRRDSGRSACAARPGARA